MLRTTADSLEEVVCGRHTFLQCLTKGAGHTLPVQGQDSMLPSLVEAPELHVGKLVLV